ncbi:leukocyte elastase inhibitor-like isoform X1 [Lytechinus variegatus]|uniref:leukocyte elastase inhibitor-like isoform X1 n=2 Tax=Lytechinus variegatus TaxID=7654 RepID=UPI001BB19D47|nr:leukocyte elastase inhibitor-like isoform X1 [Lytechinus variegatus]
MQPVSACIIKGMGNQYFHIAAAMLLSLVMMGSRVNSTEVSEHTMKLARANNEFAVNLYKALSETHPDQNLFFSPLSVSTALGMTHLGARGTSSKQMREVLRFDLLEEEHLHASFKQLNALFYESSSKYTLKSANKLFGKAGAEFLQEFLDNTGNFYNSAFEAVKDFAAPEARKGINDWVAKETENKIQNLIPDGILNSLTKLVLVNAIYFKSTWDQAFDNESTKSGVFKMDQETAHLRMMHKEGEPMMTDDKTRKCFVLEMPYDGNDLSMLAVLPWDDDGLEQVEEQMTMEALDFWDSDLEPEQAMYWFPRFKLEDTFSLSSILQSMGMTDPFESGKADFSGITGDQSLHISEVIHKAFVEVNEEGTEAAAATGVTMMKRSLGKRYRLRFDHPFLFLIRDRRTKAVLFMGRLVDPPHETRVPHEEL